MFRQYGQTWPHLIHAADADNKEFSDYIYVCVCVCVCVCVVKTLKPLNVNFYAASLFADHREILFHTVSSIIQNDASTFQENDLYSGYASHGESPRPFGMSHPVYAIFLSLLSFRIIFLCRLYLINYCEHFGKRRSNYACLPTSPLGAVIMMYQPLF